MNKSAALQAKLVEDRNGLDIPWSNPKPSRHHANAFELFGDLFEKLGIGMGADENKLTLPSTPWEAEAAGVGHPADIEELELDLENGWAYKLLAMFGIRQKLTLEESCSGSKYLLDNGVPASHISAIGSNYLELRHEANTRGFQDGTSMELPSISIIAT